MTNLYKNYVTNEYTVKKWIENELKKRVRFDNIITETINFNKIFGGSATLGGTNNGNGELIIKDSSDVEKVKINNLGITLADDTEIIGGDGVLSTFQYNGTNDRWFEGGSSYVNGYWFLGYNTNMLDTNWANYIFFDINIPSNFTISDARITIFHSPVYWDNGGNYALWGYCRNIKAYTVTNYNTIGINAAYASEYAVDYTYTFSSPIDSAFGSSGFTANVPTTPSHNGQIVTSGDIASSLAVGFNKIAIKTGDAIPTFNASVATNGANLGAKTGMVFAVLNVTGYQGKE